MVGLILSLVIISLMRSHNAHTEMYVTCDRYGVMKAYIKSQGTPNSKGWKTIMTVIRRAHDVTVLTQVMEQGHTFVRLLGYTASVQLYHLALVHLSCNFAWQAFHALQRP
jgi:hypothetical protein